MKRFLRSCHAFVRLSFLELWRRNDIFGLLVFALVLMIPLSMAKPFGTAGAVRYMDEVALLLIWGFSFFISIGAGSRLFPPEFESRTIYPLFAKPASRGSVLFGKFLGAWAASLSALLFFYFLFALACGLRDGLWFPSDLIQAVILHAAFTAVAVAIALLGSLLMTPSANLTLSVMILGAMLFFGRRLPAYAEGLSAPLAALVKTAYVIAPHVEFFDLRQRVIHGWGGVSWGVVLIVLVYAAAYTAACLLLARIALGRKKV